MPRCSHTQFSAIVEQTAPSTRCTLLILVTLNMLLFVPLARGAPADESESTAAADPSKNHSAGREAPWHMSISGLPPIDERLPDAPFVADDSFGTYSPTITIVGGLSASSVDCKGIIPNGAAAPNSSRLPRSISLDERLTLPSSDGYIPNLAKEISFSSESNVADISLLNANWSDGHPVTGADIAFSLELAEKHGIHQPIMRFLNELPSASNVREHSLQLAFFETVYDINFLLSQIEIYPAHRTRAIIDDQEYGEGLSNFNIRRDFRICARGAGVLPSLGAYTLVSYETTGGTSKAVYRANPYYFKVDSAGRQQPYFEQVEHHIVNQIDSMLHYARLSSETPIVIELPASAIARIDDFRELGTIEVATRPVPGRGAAAAYLFNYTHPQHGYLFRSEDFRRATVLAIDRQVIAQIYRPEVTGVTVQTAAIEWVLNGDGEPYDHDVAAARKLVHLPNEEILLSILVNKQDRLAVSAAAQMASDWEALSIKAAISPVSRWELYNREAQHEFEVVLRSIYLQENRARMAPGLLVPPFTDSNLQNTFSIYESACGSDSPCDPIDLAEIVLAWHRGQLSTSEMLDAHESKLLIIGLVSPLPDVEIYGPQLTGMDSDFRKGSDAYFVSE